MKRNELKVGEEYAVLAPSQQFHPGRYSAVPAARRVMVLDTEPVWKSVSSYRWREEEKVKPVIYHGEKVQPRYDASFSVKGETGWYAAEAKRSVKVLEVQTSWGTGDPEYVVTTVALSQIRMTWAEFEAESRKAEAETARIQRARARTRRVEQEAAEHRRTQRDKVAAILEGTRLSARILEGSVVIAGSFEDLKAVAGLIRGSRERFRETDA